MLSVAMISLWRLWVCAGTAWLALGAAAAAECFYPPEPSPTLASAEEVSGRTWTDNFGRMVAGVTVNGRGPYRFIVDTGANRSVISAGLAAELGLVSHGAGEVHSVHGVTTAPLVRVERLQYGDMQLQNEELPLLQGAVLAGEAGLLGTDGMRDLRLRMDFERHCIELTPSRNARRLRGWAAIRGELHFGHLVVVRGSINGLHVNLLLDTGSDSSLANPALRDALNARIRTDRSRIDYAIAYTAGRPVVLENSILLPRFNMGELEVRNVTAYVGDFHIFRLWNLVDEPTLLIGMDVLTQARGLAIDYGRGAVYLHIRDDLDFGTRLLN
ncbi:retroviral-like aspartic protease family protein [Terricaulis sp.]|uniref:retroviral-like aspartic protease family protein n=1 Tax=Terricaulis sp. TaxID=2768686 RepID=UPI0037850A40